MPALLVSMLRGPARATLFPYTTLFRSGRGAARQRFASDTPRPPKGRRPRENVRSEEHTSELQSLRHLVCRLLLEKKNKGLGEPRRIDAVQDRDVAEYPLYATAKAISDE